MDLPLLKLAQIAKHAIANFVEINRIFQPFEVFKNYLTLKSP